MSEKEVKHTPGPDIWQISPNAQIVLYHAAGNNSGRDEFYAFVNSRYADPNKRDGYHTYEQAAEALARATS